MKLVLALYIFNHTHKYKSGCMSVCVHHWIILQNEYSPLKLSKIFKKECSGRDKCTKGSRIVM